MKLFNRSRIRHGARLAHKPFDAEQWRGALALLGTVLGLGLGLYLGWQTSHVLAFLAVSAVCAVLGFWLGAYALHVAGFGLVVALLYGAVSVLNTVFIWLKGG